MKDRKELKNSYKEKPEIGGVYVIKCAGNGRAWLKKAQDLQGKINRFNFSVSIDTCPESDMRAEWEKYGTQSFSISVLEEFRKGENQTDREFSDDIDALLMMWTENMAQGTCDTR